MEIKRLTAVAVKNLSRPGRHADGGGLYLVVGASKQWVFLYQRNGRRREMGLGGYPAVSLNDARGRAQAARDALTRGDDPVDARKAERPATESFSAFCEDVIESLKSGWRGAKTEAGWRRSLLTHAKALADKRVDEIGTDDVLAVLKPLWATKPESAGKLRERLETVLDAATARKLRRGDNPARWRGHLSHLLAKRATLTRGHHRALPYADAPAFFARLLAEPSVSAKALAFVILTAAREGMVRHMLWREVSPDRSLWTVPAGKMKTNKEFRVPLSRAAQDVMATMPEGPGDTYAFPGGRKDSPLSNAAPDKVLSKLGVDAVATIHGFRSTFRDWAGDKTEHPRDLIETALAHAVGDQVERAYRRADALLKRRLLMEDWARYLTRPSKPDRDKPVARRRGSGSASRS